ncbi:MAG: 5'-methylthioadenosine/adenosylhomocysteine nucleosidase [Suipraeoptans sp.]
MIGIIGAMEEEVSVLKDIMEDKEISEHAGMTFNKGKLCGKEVIVVKSGVGKVNAGICTQILIDKFGVTMLVNTGVAGALDYKIEIGDVVISTDSVQHDVNAVAFGYEVGQIPRMDTLFFKADEKLANWAKAVNEAVNPEVKTYIGRIATGDQFIADAKTKKRIIDDFSPLCVEMEGAAIAQVAYMNKVPYIISRAISDKADDSAQVDYPEFEAKAIERSVRLIQELMSSL